MRSVGIKLAFFALLIAQSAFAVQYYEDDRSGGSDVAGLPHYRSPEEACVAGVFQRLVKTDQEGDNHAYRYISVNVGTDDGFGEFACQGTIQYSPFVIPRVWVTHPSDGVVSRLVYGPFGASETCTLGNYKDPETGQCGPPKCTDSCCDSTCGNGSNPIVTASGNKHQAETDFIGTGPFPLEFTRTYDSKRIWLANPAPIGIAWTHRYQGQIVVAPPAGSSTLSEAIVYRPDGRILRFNLSGGVWTPDADVSERLNVTLSGSDYVSATFTTNDDDVESYDQLGRLASITNRDGFIQTLNYTTVSSGNTISHDYVQTVTDPQGHVLTFGYSSRTFTNSVSALELTSLTDSNGAVIQFDYDTSSNGNLQTVTYPDLNSTTTTRTYYYNGAGPYGGTGQTGGVSQPNALTGIQDENAQSFASWGYDSQGRGVLSVHGPYTAGTIDRTSLAFNGDGTTTVTDGLTQQRKFTFQVQNLVARYTVLDQPLESCGTTFAGRTYDGNGYPASGTDFRSFQTTFAFAANDSHGHARGLETQRDEAKTQSEERITNTTWNANFRVPDQRTVTNHGSTIETRTNWVYNTRGQPLAECEYDLTVSGAGSYVCSASGAPPAGIRRWVYTYCDSVNTAAPDPIGSVGENLGKGCPLVGLVRRIVGPRTDVNDWTTTQYYLANDSSMPPKYLAGDLAQVVDALGHTTQYLSYDGNGRLLQMQDANGISSSMGYHPRGWIRLSTVCANANCSPSANDATTQTDYDGVGNVLKVTQPDGVFLSYMYDNAHRLKSITDNLGNHLDYTLDALGHRTAEKTFDVSDAVNPRRLLTRAYNTLSRMTDQYDALVRDTHFSYDGDGNRTDKTDALSVKTHWDYDGLNRLKDRVNDYQGSDVSTANSTIGYAYDTRNNVTSINDPSLLPTTYTFDDLDDLKTLQSPDTGTTQYPTYDAAGNRITQTDNRGTTWTMAYDALNRLTSVMYPTTSLNVTYAYDAYPGSNPCAATSYPIGRLASIADASGSTTFCYDLRGNTVQKIQVAHAYRFDTRYTYNTADRLMSIKYPSGALVSYGRDGDGRIQTVSVTPPGGSATSILTNVTWQPFGPPITYTFAQGSQALTKTYDQNYWLTDVSGSALNLHFCRDAMSNITSLASAAPACSSTTIEQYVYDNLYRLAHVKDGLGGALQDFTYNVTGDRLTKTLQPSPTQTYTYAPSTHQLDAVGANVRMLDPNGNTTEITGTATLDFTFDDRNRMTALKRNTTPITTYDYDGKGERVYKTTTYPASDTRWFTFSESANVLGEYTATSVQEYLWADNTPVAILDVSGQSLTLADRIFGNGFEQAATVTSALAYVHSDQLESPRAVTSTTGTGLWSWPWLSNPFGESSPTGSMTVNLRFPGQYSDAESGLIYNGFRDYEPAAGRYVESDPIGLKGDISTYGYASSRPTQWFDAAGLYSESGGCGGAGGVTQCDGMGNWEIVNCNHGCTRPCTQAHEEQHFKDYPRRFGANSCRGVPEGGIPTDQDHHVVNPAPGGGWVKFQAWSECHGNRAGKACAEKLPITCKNSQEVKDYIKQADKWIRYYRCDAYHW